MPHTAFVVHHWCADDQKSSTEAPRCLAAIQQHTSDLLEAIEDDEHTSEERSTKLAIYHKMGAAHAKAGEHEAAEAAYSKAQELCVRTMANQKRRDVPEPQRVGIMTGCMALILDRLTNAWKLHQMDLASDLLTQATDLLQQATLPSQQRFAMRRQDILKSLDKGKKSQVTRDIDAENLLAYSHQLVTGHLDRKDDGSESFQRTVTSLQAQVLRLLSQAYLLSGQPAHALACVQGMRKLQDPPDDDPGLSLTSIEALIQLERPEQADAELLALVSHKGASADLCLETLSAVIQEPRCSALKPAADIMLERFAEDATAPQHKVLRLLSQAYLLSGQASQALACVEKARKLQNTPDDAPGLCLTAIEALTQLERPEEADEELLELLVDKSASADQCLAGLSAVLRAPGRSVPKAAAQYILERFDDNAAVCLRLYQALLGTPEGEKNISREREAVLLKLLRYKQIPSLFKKEDGPTRDMRKTLCMQLWDHAVQLYNSRDYRASANFYIAAMHWTDRSSATWAALDKECQRINRAMPEVFRDRAKFDMASAIDDAPSSDPNTVKIKARKALDRLRPLLKSEDPSLNFGAALVKELLLVCNNAAAKQTLSWLWEEVLAAPGPCKRPREGLVIENLIEMSAAMEEGYTLETHHLKLIPAGEEYECSKPSPSSDGSSNKNSIHQELARLFSQALHRIEAVGLENFCGGQAAPWFGGASYNAAIMAMKAKDPTAAAVLFRTCGSFHEIVNMTTPGYWTVRRETYMLGIRCTMDEYASHPERKSCLIEARALHKKASAALEAAVQLPVDPKDLVKFRKALWNVELDLAMKEGHYSQMVPLIERARTEGLFTAEELLHIGHVSLEIPDIPHAPSAKAAFRAALQLMRMQQEPPSRMDKLAETVNELYKVSSDEEALNLLADAGTYVRSMAYPSSEMSWLITTAWDRGCKHAQYGHHAQALAFLAAAIELMEFCDAFKDTKEDFKNLYEQLTKDHSEAGAAST